MTRIGLAVHRFRPDALTAARSVAAYCDERGIQVVAPEADLAAIATDMVLPGDVSELDLLVSIGGDGTMLRAVGSLGGLPVPVMGVNVGTLGYLATVDADRLLEALAHFLSGEPGIDYDLDVRMLLEVSVWTNGARLSHHLALNEVALEKKEAGHTVRLAVDIDRERFTTFVADGLIVATPTGSTAYSLSARGPILSPRLRAMLLTPLSPHMLFDRSMVLDPSESVRIEVGGHRDVHIATDGQWAHTLGPGDVVEVRAADETARFVRFEQSRFHRTLKTKFGLEDR